MNYEYNLIKMQATQPQSKFLSSSIDFNYRMLVHACKFTTLYILNKFSQRDYLLEDPLERQYRVKIDKLINCSCHQGNLGHCIHSLYILIRVYKLPEDHPFIFKNTYTDDDITLLNEAGKNSVLKLNKKVTKVVNSNDSIEKLQQQLSNLKPVSAKIQVKDSKGKQDKKQQQQWPTFEADTVCPICYDQIENQTPIIDCHNCRNYFHTKCLHVWVTKKQNESADTSCPMCRSKFQQKISQRIVKMEKYYVQYHQSHGINCSSCGKDILIKLYKCLLCEDLYLCKDCYLKWEHNNHDRFIGKQGKRAQWSVSSRSEFNINKLNANLQYMRKFGQNSDTKSLMGQKYQQFMNSYIKKPSLLQHILNSLMDVEKEVHKTYKKLDFYQSDIVCCLCKKKKIVGMRRMTCKHFVDDKCLKFLLLNGMRCCPLDKKFILPGFKGTTIKFQ